MAFLAHSVLSSGVSLSEGHTARFLLHTFRALCFDMSECFRVKNQLVKVKDTSSQREGRLFPKDKIISSIFSLFWASAYFSSSCSLCSFKKVSLFLLCFLKEYAYGKYYSLLMFFVLLKLKQCIHVCVCVHARACVCVYLHVYWRVCVFACACAFMCMSLRLSGTYSSHE